MKQKVISIKNDLKNAALAYSKILKHLPDESWLLHNIGVCYLSDGNFSEALKYFEKGKENDSFDFFDFDLLSGLCLVNLQRYGEARKSFQESVRKYGENPGTDNLIALCNKLLIQG